MKSRGGKSQGREERKKEDQKRKNLRRKRIQVREKVGKSRNAMFFQWFGGPEGQKCTPLWREAHFQVKMYKAHQVRTTFGSWDVEKVHAVVARSTFRTQKWKNWRVRSTFRRLDVLSRGKRTGLCILSKASKTWGFCSISKNDGRRGTLRRSAKTNFPWQAQYKRHVHQRC